MSTLKKSILLPDAGVVFLSTKLINSLLKDKTHGRSVIYSYVFV